MKIKPLALCIATCATLSSCGGSSGGSDPGPTTPPDPGPTEPQNTLFSVSLTAPDSLQNPVAGAGSLLLNALLPSAYAVDGLDVSAENFIVAVVDTSGNVVEEIEIAAENISRNPDGTWEIAVPGDPRLDCLVVVDINKPAVIQTGAPLPDDLLFAPTTQPDIDVTIASTAAYENFIGSLNAQAGDTFASLGFDVDAAGDLATVNQLVETVEQTYRGLIDTGTVSLNDFTSVDTLLAAIDDVVEAVVQQEVANIQGAVAGTVADLFQPEGAGAYWFSVNFDDEEIERGQLPVTGFEIFHEFDGQNWGEAQTFALPADDDLVLTAGGWVNSADWFTVVAVDTGTVTIADAAIDAARERISSTQAVNLEGRDIGAFFSLNGEAADLNLAIVPDAVFSAGATAYRIDITTVNDLYALWFEPGDEATGECPWDANKNANTYNGNCETAALIQNGEFVIAAETLETLLSTTPGSAETGDIKGVMIAPSASGEEEVVVELLDDADKTANFYLFDWSLGSYLALDTGTWSAQTPAGLASNEQSIVVPLPATVISAGDVDNDEQNLVFAVESGWVRPGNFIAAGTVTGNGERVFNATANEDIVAATEFTFLDTLGVTLANACTIESMYEDPLYDGIGGPTTATAYTSKAFVRVAELCTRQSTGGGEFTDTMIAAKVFINTDGEQLAFNAGGSGTLTDGGGVDNFTWNIDANGHLVVDYAEIVVSGTSGAGYTVDEVDTFTLVGAGEVLVLRVFFQADAWLELGPDGPGTAPELNKFQGEIWPEVWTAQ